MTTYLPSALNTLGLCLDILGVLILFKYGLPSKAEPLRLLLEHDGAEYGEKLARCQRGARIGLLLLIPGFTSQIAATWAR